MCTPHIYISIFIYESCVCVCDVCHIIYFCCIYTYILNISNMYT